MMRERLVALFVFLTIALQMIYWMWEEKFTFFLIVSIIGVIIYWRKLYKEYKEQQED